MAAQEVEWARKLAWCFRKDGSLIEKRLACLLFTRRERTYRGPVDDLTIDIPQEAWDYYMRATLGRDPFDIGWVYDEKRPSYMHTARCVQFIIQKYEEKRCVQQSSAVA